MANTEKHRKKVLQFMQTLEKKGLVYQWACRLDTREPEYQFTEKGLRLGGAKKLLKGVM